VPTRSTPPRPPGEKARRRWGTTSSSVLRIPPPHSHISEVRRLPYKKGIRHGAGAHISLRDRMRASPLWKRRRGPGQSQSVSRLKPGTLSTRHRTAHLPSALHASQTRSPDTALGFAARHPVPYQSPFNADDHSKRDGGIQVEYEDERIHESWSCNEEELWRAASSPDAITSALRRGKDGLMHDDPFDHEHRVGGPPRG